MQNILEIYYLTRDTFKDQPHIHKIFEAVLNYYGNYDAENQDLDSCKDEFTQNLFTYNEISQFWDLNKDFVNNYKKLIYGWAVNLCNIIKEKYAKNDPELKPRKRIRKSKNY